MRHNTQSQNPQPTTRCLRAPDDFLVSQTIRKSQASAEQRACYLEAGLEVQAGLEEAVRLIKLQRSTISDPDERRRVSAHILGLRAAHASVLADLVGFLSDAFRLRAPDASDLDDLKQSSHATFAMLPGRNSLRDIMLTANRLLQKWAETRPADLESQPLLRLEAS